MPDTTQNTSLEAAVTAAVETPINTQVEATVVPETPVATETTVETPVVETPTTPVETSEQLAERQETEKARNVYKLLNDPATAPQIVRMLAEQLGITQREAKEVVQKQPGVADLLAAALGEEYAFLAPKFAPALEQYMEQRIAPLQQQIARTAANNEFQTALTKINGDTKGDFQKHEARITALMDEIKPASGVSVEKYLNNLYKLAKSETPAPPPSETVKKVISKMENNAREALPSPSAATENRIVKGPKLPTLDDAIAAAMRGESFE